VALLLRVESRDLGLRLFVSVYCSRFGASVGGFLEEIHDFVLIREWWEGVITGDYLVMCGRPLL
jgi:hypothetical protein